jgi:ABC-type transporter Mla subunit MlaD
MGTTTASILYQIERQRESVIDLDSAVDGARSRVNDAVEQLRDAVRERGRAVIHLAQLVDWHEELESIGRTFGPEIATMVESHRREACG